MSIGQVPIGQLALDEELEGAEPEPSVVGLDYWIVIQGRIEPTVKIDSISTELVLNGKSTLTCELLNPITLPLAGQAISCVYQGATIFGGVIQTITLTAGPDETVKSYALDCVGWDGVLERHILKSSYTNTLAGVLITAAFSDEQLDEDGFQLGIVDDGPMILLADADYVRVSEYMRDIAMAGGGNLRVTPTKVIYFKRINLEAAPFDITAPEAESVEVSYDLDQYCNKQIVKVTGASGNSTVITRADSAEIAARQAVEGGSGVYETYQSIQHPTSDNILDLARLGVSVAFLFMQSRRLRVKVQVRLRRSLLDIGQLLTINIPGMNVSGQFQILRRRAHDIGAKMLFEVEAVLTGARQLELDSLLKIVQAGKATIVLPVEDFAHVVEFTTTGLQFWVVPGTGTVQVELGAYGAGGGGGGGLQNGSVITQGGRGGPGGKAVSFREFAAGTVLGIFVGTKGTGGAPRLDSQLGGFPGTNGTESWVHTEPDIVQVEALGGLGGYGAYAVGLGPNPAPDGAPGSGTGDYVFPGEGSLGGDPGIGFQFGADGNNGYVYIRY